MKYVLCYCCDKYEVVFEDTNELGLCRPCKKVVSAYDEVCKELIMRRGFHTEREIPDYCKNYKK
ncbi:MAG: hypothetical protein IJ027_03590 [Oscillospiraceae bacterium]|nr:hypothetical protein [Oscillospiraceae bacterium]